MVLVDTQDLAPLADIFLDIEKPFDLLGQRVSLMLGITGPNWLA